MLPRIIRHRETARLKKSRRQHDSISRFDACSGRSSGCLCSIASGTGRTPSGDCDCSSGRRPAEIRLQTKAPILDIRGGHPQNWAHFLNIHLALVALTCRETGRTPDHLHLLLPEDTPPYVKAAADLARLEVTYTDNTVVGEGIALGFKDWNVIRGERCALPCGRRGGASGSPQR